MINNFWIELEKPIKILAPMASVTDSAFRQILCKYGKPDVFLTEFVPADALMNDKGREVKMIDLYFDKKEKPIVAQIFTSNAKHIFKTANLLKDMGFDGIDINMGCPEKNIQKQGAGASLIRTPELAKELISACQEGAPNLPISVKTRIGYLKNEVESWFKCLGQTNLAALIVHGRTKKQMYQGFADWEAIKNAGDIVKSLNKNIIFIGNGDIKSLDEGLGKTEKYDLDGFAVGRAVLGNPWFFNKKEKKEDKSLEKIIATLKEHAETFDKLYSGKKNFLIMRGHFSGYISGFPGAKELRMKLMQVKNIKDLESAINNM